jgi:phenylpyruvate tautomerase PptA (4-oxalocrotonate tautomerase family)
MPRIHVTSNLSLSDAEKNNALHTLSQAVSELLNKPERFVMTSWATAKMTMAGTDAAAAFVELRTLRLPTEDTERLSKELCERLSLTAEIRADRIFINFVDVEPGNWGWDGKVFS